MGEAAGDVGEARRLGMHRRLSCSRPQAFWMGVAP